uniref:Menorin-like domain-containing protein n=1 Tax=Ditylum brightwellii TaxID=49249 RepID=A0A7S4QC85_9STRA
MLPSPHQSWAHSTCTVAELTKAIQDDSITAIESDILMGTDTSSSSTSSKQPIMAHPPERTSDLSFTTFMEMTSSCNKHLKLDIKEKECIPPILTTLKKENTKDAMIYFNADILPGPGVRGTVPIPPPAFLQPCLEFLETQPPQTAQSHYAFSLGWRTDCRSIYGYTPQDISKMEEVMLQYSLLEKSAGVVLAVNARVLAKSPSVLDDTLDEFGKTQKLQVLIWTGTGEPPISNRIFSNLKDHFERIGCQDLVGFDCQVGTVVLFVFLFLGVCYFSLLHQPFYSFIFVCR